MASITTQSAVSAKSRVSSITIFTPPLSYYATKEQHLSIPTTNFFEKMQFSAKIRHDTTEQQYFIL
jgi:hypothetical protein